MGLIKVSSILKKSNPIGWSGDATLLVGLGTQPMGELLMMCGALPNTFFLR